jgi:hypothetical protein
VLICGLPFFFALIRVHSRFWRVLALVFVLILPSVNRHRVAVWIVHGRHSASGKIQRFNHKLDACLLELVDRLIEIGDFEGNRTTVRRGFGLGRYTALVGPGWFGGLTQTRRRLLFM